MRNHQPPGARRLVLATLCAFAALAPTASADTALPVWTCRASAAYIELDPLLGPQRIEPVVANGFANRDAPDAPQCTRQTHGVPNITVPPQPTDSNVQLTLQAPFARTDIDPPLAAARQQTATATGGVVDPLRITLGDLVITARAVSAEAEAACVGTTPTLTGSSTVAELTIGTQVITIPSNGAPAEIDLGPLGRVRLNEQVREGSETTEDQALTQRAVHIELLQGPTHPAANIVLGEAKVDRRGAVCAPPPPPPACPSGTVAQDPGADPLVCVLTVTAPCPAGSTPDPAAGGACVIVREVTREAPPANCPSGTVRDPATNNCILLVQRPCPEGSTPDPTTRVCVVRVQTNVGSGVPNNGRIGGPGGPRATCGRVTMRFVRGGRRTLTNRFGTRVVTRGRLVTCERRPRPIVGARIDVVHVLPDGRRLRKTGLRSRPGGRLTLILPLDLRSRRIEYAFRPDLSSTRATSRVTLRLTVRDRRGRVLR